MGGLEGVLGVLVLRSSPAAMDSLAAPIGGQQLTPAADVFARLRAAGGDQ
ncbi:hypothetical protein ACWC9T_17170 [Kitasatospora sp. NPDC001159]